MKIVTIQRARCVIRTLQGHLLSVALIPKLALCENALFSSISCKESLANYETLSK